MQLSLLEEKAVEKRVVKLGMLPRCWVLVLSNHDSALAWKPDELHLPLLAHSTAVGHPDAWPREEVSAFNDSLEREPGLRPAVLCTHDMKRVHLPKKCWGMARLKAVTLSPIVQEITGVFERRIISKQLERVFCRRAFLLWLLGIFYLGNLLLAGCVLKILKILHGFEIYSLYFINIAYKKKSG